VTSRDRLRPSRRVVLRRVTVGLVCGAAATVLAGLLLQTPFGVRAEAATYDLRVRRAARPVAADSPIVIVEINDASIRALAPVVGRWPWPRMVHASAIDYFARAGARTIAYDILFGEPEGRSDIVVNGRPISGEASDAALVASVAKAGNVVLLADATGQGSVRGGSSADPSATPQVPGPSYRPGPGFQARPDIELPFPELSAAAAAVGHNVLAKDDSDAARRMLPFVDVHGAAVPSLGVAAALSFLGTPPADVMASGDVLRLGPARMPLLHAPVIEDDRTLPSSQVLFRLSQPIGRPDGATSTFPTYAFFDVLLAEDELTSGRAPNIPLSAFAGKLVFVGTSAAGLVDRYASPFPAGAAGVELHATLADNILTRRFMRRVTATTDAAVTFGAAAIAGLAAAVLPVAVAAGVALAMIAGLTVWLTHAIGQGVWVSLVMPATASATALFGGVAWRYVVEDREKRHLRRLFGRYVSHDVIEQLIADPALAHLGGQRREMTVLFSDIRGFTTASEQGAPEAVVAQLNEYFGAMVEVLFRHRGTLDKFVGDMVMGLFGAPLPDPQHADHAVAAAREMITTLAALNARWRAAGRPTLDIGIGINSGEMIAGNIGSEAIMSYTVIGDAVNLGSRLESLNKEYGTHILISEATRLRLTTPVETRRIGDATVKGRTQAVQVYEVATAGTGAAAPHAAPAESA
jgi:adenylate cyclase